MIIINMNQLIQIKYYYSKIKEIVSRKERKVYLVIIIAIIAFQKYK